MVIAGLLKTTLLDYPGMVASTVFTPGCNMRCPFCHNMDIVDIGLNNRDHKTGMGSAVLIDEEEVLDFLHKRAGIIEGVCITGGEPTLQKDLSQFITKVKALGLKIKLDTNGTNPEIIEQLSEAHLIDYIAMDIKSSLEEYPNACGDPAVDLTKIKESIDYLISSPVQSEFRTTVVNELHDEKIMEDIGKLIKGAKRYYLQSFKDSGYVPCHDFTCADDDKMCKYRQIVSKYADNVEIRGRDI